MRIIEIASSTIVLDNFSGTWDFMLMSEVYQQWKNLRIFKPNYSFDMHKAEDALFSKDVIILYFADVPKEFHLDDLVGLKIGPNWYEYNYENSRKIRL